MNIREEITEDHPDVPLRFLSEVEYDKAIVGVCDGISIQHNPKVVYDVDKVIEANMSMGMSYEEALEHFSYNQEGAYMGEHTPVFIQMYDQTEPEAEADKGNLFKRWIMKNLQRVITNMEVLFRV